MQRVVYLFLLILLVGCQNNPGQPQQLTAQQIMQQTAEKMKTVNAVHIVLEVEGGTMNISNFNVRSLEGDLVRPDKSRIKAKVAASGSFIIEQEILTIGEQQWVTNPITKKWQKAPNVIAFTPLDANKGIGALLLNAKDVEKKADNTIDGTPVYHITGIVDGKDLNALLGMNSDSSRLPADIWIGKGDLLPRQIKLSGAMSPNESQLVSRTIRLTKYNEPVTIEPPQS